MVRQLRTACWQAIGVARANNYPIHTGQHGTVHDVHERYFDLVQEVDEDIPAMPFFGKPDFGESGGDQQLNDLCIQLEWNLARVAGLPKRWGNPALRM